ncbi:MAG: phosphotransferase [bacterium]|nr:phosphotransferase [bacterium]
MRQNYDKIFLQNILDQYNGLGKIDRFFLYTSGYENSNYYIQTREGQYVIKIFEGIGVKPENILFELEVIDFLRQSGIKAPGLLKNSGGGLATAVNKKYACVMDFVDGANMNKRSLSDSLVIEAAEEAAKMDLALKGFRDGSKTRQNFEWDIKCVLVLEKFIPLLPKDFDKEIFGEILVEFRGIKNEFEKMPVGLIHNDIVPHNWLVSDGKLNSIIDFSDMVFSPYIQNVAVALHLICFCYNYNPEQAKMFTESYRRFNPLSKNEIRLLYLLIKVRFFSFVVEFNHMNVEYGFDRQRVETVNDNYKFLKRFINFGQKEFDELVGI